MANRTVSSLPHDGSGAVELVANTEVAVVSTPAFPIGEAPGTGLGVIVSGMVYFQSDTTANAMIYRVRKGAGLTGPIVGPELTHQWVIRASGLTDMKSFEVHDTDTIYDPEGVVYTLTCQQQNATNNGTIMYAVLGVAAIASRPG